MRLGSGNGRQRDRRNRQMFLKCYGDFSKLPDSDIGTRPFRRANPSNYISSLQKAVS
jgi:hypothetical protein